MNKKIAISVQQQKFKFMATNANTRYVVITNVN